MTLYRIRTSIRPAIDDDLIKLQKYSATHGNLTPLESYDIDYWKQKHTTQYYSIDPARVMQYFPFQKVLNGLFDIAKSFFNVELRVCVTFVCFSISFSFYKLLISKR